MSSALSISFSIEIGLGSAPISFFHFLSRYGWSGQSQSHEQVVPGSELADAGRNADLQSG